MHALRIRHVQCQVFDAISFRWTLLLFFLGIIAMTSWFPVYSEFNQELIMAQGGICLLAMTASDAEDPQTLRMVAGAVANLCGNGRTICLS